MNISLLLLLAVASCANAATLRQQRDVSHLPLEYLPPVVLPPLPSRDYLPPVEQHAASLPHVLQPPRDYLPPVVEQEQEQVEEEQEQPKLNNEYLPPVREEQQLAEEISTTEASTTSTTEEPTTTTEEALPTTTTEEAVPEETEAPLEVKTHEHIEEPSGILEADGYHYRTPEIVPDLSPAPVLPALPAVDAYLPPLDDNAVLALEEDAVPVAVAVPSPHSDESAALLDDGYHYRAIRRLRF